jgi:molybdopterin-binding protein
MQLSARNQLKGTVKAVSLGPISAEVIIDIGGQEVVSTITRSSAERLALAAGDAVVAIIKASEVLIGK